ncbi:MAG TPA: potassium transporter Kup [Verrucomicrobiae bacterium]|nr:potassium transporter Kup [Verrucomicrobiae bacterium]
MSTKPLEAPGAAAGNGSVSAERRRFFGLALGSVGVVFGDIGTSPLYAFRESIRHASGDGLTRGEIIGTVSLLLWALILVITLKYIFFIMRADNKGEGGLLSLMALAQGKRTSMGIVFILGIVGASLFYGDAVLTPAISVLSAVEGLKLVTPVFTPFVIPITIAILFLLFAMQNRGTQKVAALFGPVTALWFIAIAALGASHLVDDFEIFNAINPYHAVGFTLSHGWTAMFVLGSVFLVLTGAEALYADMGHFGRKPIRAAWLAFVLPALAINYLGQGAYVLKFPEGADNPFFRMTPDWALAPMVALATVATVIASQAVITGAFSLTRQAIQLGLLPRMEIRHTSADLSGQIYLPHVNRLLLIGVVLLVLLFASSARLASAYGIAVAGTMMVETLLAFVYLRRVRQWGWGGAILLIAPFLFLDIIFVGANGLKLADGGYAPVLLALVIIVLIWSWVRGSRLLLDKLRRESVDLADLVTMVQSKSIHRVPGTAVFLTNNEGAAPSALMHNLKHNKVLHAQNFIVTVHTADTPRADPDKALVVERLSDEITKVSMTFGFMETPNVPRLLSRCRKDGFEFDIMTTSFFLSHRSLKPAMQSPMPRWQDRLFVALASRATSATDFFQIPSQRVVEMGMQILI